MTLEMKFTKVNIFPQNYKLRESPGPRNNVNLTLRTRETLSPNSKGNIYIYYFQNSRYERTDAH